ncbi:PREDICTED: cuticle protein 18.7-like [Nicrophorus vespilloides]|uniref:Cuticle protein 18.7-like n=1 Tax=Nicrophorus vespilloides TaxID=110193 RepID=A0ABM1M7N5_NICVS|nr:PREDICTED: cuticle protein 18.7-like [Nicrophorus vespilloides]
MFGLYLLALWPLLAGYVAPVVYGAQHLPLIGADGVPVDTAEVQHARAAHLVHKINVEARNGDYLHHGLVAAAPVGYSAHLAAPVVAHHGVYSAHHVPAAYPTTHVLPTSVNGVPLETPEVVAAKVNHFAAHAEALTRNAHALHYRKRRGIFAAAPLAYTAPIAYQAQHLPLINGEGVPVDTAEVQHARAAHLVHKVNAQIRNGDYHHVVAAHAPIVSAYAHPYSYATPLAHYYKY